MLDSREIHNPEPGRPITRLTNSSSWYRCDVQVLLSRGPSIPASSHVSMLNVRFVDHPFGLPPSLVPSILSSVNLSSIPTSFQSPLLIKLLMVAIRMRSRLNPWGIFLGSSPSSSGKGTGLVVTVTLEGSGKSECLCRMLSECPVLSSAKRK